MAIARHLLSPLDGRYAEIVEPIAAIGSEEAFFKFRTIVMIAWLKRILTLDEIPCVKHHPHDIKELHRKLDMIIEQFSDCSIARIKAIEKTTRHDVKAVEYYIREQIESDVDLKPFSSLIHFGCTSEDVNNLAYGLMLTELKNAVLLPKLDQILNTLSKLASEYADIAMPGHTHGQAATPTTIGKEFANFADRLKKAVSDFRELNIEGKLGGAVGTLSALRTTIPSVDWTKESLEFVESLGLSHNALTTQIEPHDYIAKLCYQVNVIDTILIGLCRDMWSYISLDYFTLQLEPGQIGSSVMPHKINPIDFENAEGNLKLSIHVLAGLAQELPISRMQRDLSDSTQLRNLIPSLANPYLAWTSLLRGLNKIAPNLSKVAAELDEHWEVLAETIQTMMRAEGMSDSYERLKQLTQGHRITKEQLHQFIKEKSGLSEDTQARLLALTPANYLGYAPEMARQTTSGMKYSFTLFQPVSAPARESGKSPACPHPSPQLTS